jgi:hypothetical protein
MLILVISLLSITIYVYITKLFKNVYLWQLIFISSIIFSFHMFEISYLSDNLFFMFDEKWFLEYAQNETIYSTLENIFKKYGIYILLEQLILNTFGIPSFLKIINFTFLLMFVIFLYNRENNELVIKYFKYFFLYLVILSFTNMRDIFMLYVLFVLIHFLTKQKTIKNVLYITLSTLIMISLRPTWVLMIYAAYFMIRFSIGGVQEKLISMAVIIFITFLTFDFITMQIARAIYFLTLENMNVESVSNITSSGTNLYFGAFLRQIFSPFPHSKLLQMFSEEPSANLYIFEICRMFMMLGFYYLIFFTIKNFKSFLIFLKVDTFYNILFVVSLVNTVFYTVYRLGGGSSRNKTLPIILLFLFYCNMKNRRKLFLGG